MIRHVALFRFREGTTAEQVRAMQEGLEALEIPSVRAYACGPDLRLGEGTWDFGVVADFDDEDGWRAYDTHPDHARVRDELIKPHLVDRAAVRITV